MQDFDRRFDKAFSMVAFAANRHLIEHMRRVSQGLELDLETVMIWGILAHLNVARSITPGAAPADILDENGYLLGPKHPVRTIDIVQVAGLPKETVRRKLERLRDAGKAQRDADGRWQVCASGVDDSVIEFTRETVKRLLSTARTIEDMLRRVELD
ncbi:hypothetical protein [Pseudothauera lacus]|uniref:HTH marR-type domain-containing protein n=1 Tax=Pseudothauera lacus TaxID=2136175 RepID=A0A2T4IBI6_9RHOO|nr:hypothetical protein [Pseudothauera lacus]PTD95131.1 hypothetical protein C8261_16000 [Pseudothauera lacus]